MTSIKKNNKKNKMNLIIIINIREVNKIIMIKKDTY